MLVARSYDDGGRRKLVQPVIEWARAQNIKRRAKC
jgi:hypothetical protein